MDNKNKKAIQVAFVIPDQCWSGSISLTTDHLAGMNLIFQDQGFVHSKAYDVSLLYHPGIFPKGISGESFNVEPLDNKQYDIVIIPAVWSITPKVLKSYQELPAWLNRQLEGGSHFISMTNSAS